MPIEDHYINQNIILFSKKASQSTPSQTSSKSQSQGSQNVPEIGMRASCRSVTCVTASSAVAIAGPAVVEGPGAHIFTQLTNFVQKISGQQYLTVERVMSCCLRHCGSQHEEDRDNRDD